MSKTQMSKHKKIMAVVIALIIILLASPYIIIPIYNNWSLENFSQQLRKVPLPEDTDLIEEIKQCGKLGGNGNGMDFLVVLIVNSKLDKGNLDLYYESVNIQDAKPGKNPMSEHPKIEVYPMTSNTIELDYLNSPIIIESINNFSETYAVVLFDGGYDADFDIRGH